MGVQTIYVWSICIATLSVFAAGHGDTSGAQRGHTSCSCNLIDKNFALQLNELKTLYYVVYQNQRTLRRLQNELNNLEAYVEESHVDLSSSRFALLRGPTDPDANNNQFVQSIIIDRLRLGDYANLVAGLENACHGIRIEFKSVEAKRRVIEAAHNRLGEAKIKLFDISANQSCPLDMRTL